MLAAISKGFFQNPSRKGNHLSVHFCFLTYIIAIWICCCKFGLCFVGIADLLNSGAFLPCCTGTSKFGLLLILELWDKICMTFK